MINTEQLDALEILIDECETRENNPMLGTLFRDTIKIYGPVEVAKHEHIINELEERGLLEKSYTTFLNTEIEFIKVTDRGKEVYATAKHS